MAITTDAAESSLNTARERLAGYNAQLPIEITKNINQAYTPIMDKASQEVANLRQEFLPKYFNTAISGQPGWGTSAADLSPTQKLTAMGRQLGQFSGDLARSQGVMDYLGANTKDLIQQAIDAAKFGYTTAQQGYQNAFGEYGLANENEQAALNRAASERAAAAQRAATSSLAGLLDLLKAQTRNQQSVTYDTKGTYGSGLQYPGPSILNVPAKQTYGQTPAQQSGWSSLGLNNDLLKKIIGK